MELTGLLLGAGASYDVGMPLVDELDRDLKRYMSPERLRDANRRSRDHHTGVSDETIEDLVKLLHQSCMNYEHIIGNLEVRSHRTHTDQGFHHLRESMSEWVYMFLLEWHVNNKEFMQRNLGLLDGITELVRRNSPLWVFSLNQDLIMEAFSTHSGIPMRCGFTDEIERLPLRDSTGSVVGDLEAQVLPSELIRDMALHFFKIGEEGINLLKIHGSLDVFATRDGHDFLKLMAVDGTVRGGIDALQLANKDLRPDWSGPTVRVTNEIVYADQDGEIQFLRRTPLTGAFKFQDAHSQVIPPKLFSIFESNLNHLSTLVCIGYSFGDIHVNRAIRAWLEMSGERFLVIVNPNCAEVPEPFRHLAPQVEIAKGVSATDYLDKVGGIARNNSDKLNRTYTAWSRKDPQAARESLVEFYKRQIDSVIKGSVEWIKTLPLRDGGLDLEAMGLTLDEFLELSKAKNPVPSADEIITKFLREVGALSDSSIP